MKPLVAILTALVILSAFILPACKKESDSTSKKEETFDQTGTWFNAGSHPTLYEMGEIKGAGPDGKNAMSIKSITDSIDGFGTYMTNRLGDDYKGKRIRMSAQMKSKDVKGWAGMWFRVDGHGKPSLAFDNMSNRSLTGTTDWKQCDIVLDVPKEASGIAFGALIGGTGQVWFTEPTFTPVDSSVASTDMDIEKIDAPADLDFSNLTSTTGPFKKAKSWFVAGDHPGSYDMGVETGVAPGGHNAGTVRSNAAESKGFGTLMQNCLVGRFAGKRIRLSALVKTQNVADSARLWMSAFAAEEDSALSRNEERQPAMKGSSDWKPYSTVIHIPKNAATLSYGVGLYGKGQIWFADVAIAVVGK